MHIYTQRFINDNFVSYKIIGTPAVLDRWACILYSMASAILLCKNVRFSLQVDDCRTLFVRFLGSHMYFLCQVLSVTRPQIVTVAKVANLLHHTQVREIRR